MCPKVLRSPQPPPRPFVMLQLALPTTSVAGHRSGSPSPGPNDGGCRHPDNRLSCTLLRRAYVTAFLKRSDGSIEDIVRLQDDGRLPRFSTCDSTVWVPHYNTRGILYARLTIALAGVDINLLGLRTSRRPLRTAVAGRAAPA